MASKKTEIVPSNSSQHALDMPGQKIDVELSPFVEQASAEGFTFSKRIKLVNGEWISGRYLGSGVAAVTDAQTGEAKDVPTALIEIKPGVSVELLAAHQVEKRLAAQDVIPGETYVLIRRGDDFRAANGRMVTDYDIGIRNPRRSVDSAAAR